MALSKEGEKDLEEIQEMIAEIEEIAEASSEEDRCIILRDLAATLLEGITGRKPLILNPVAKQKDINLAENS